MVETSSFHGWFFRPKLPPTSLAIRSDWRRSGSRSGPRSTSAAARKPARRGWWKPPPSTGGSSGQSCRQHPWRSDLIGGDQVLVAVLDPLQRPPESQRGEDGGNLLLPRVVLQAKAAANILGDPI